MAELMILKLQILINLKMNKFFSLLLLIIFTITCQGNVSRSSVSCEFIEGIAASDEYQCGKINVPENHDKPEHRKIEISYIILYAKDNLSKANPVIYLAGGAGWCLTYTRQHCGLVKASPKSKTGYNSSRSARHRLFIWFT